MSGITFSDLPLHDAILGNVEVAWEKKLCRLYLLVFTVAGEAAAPHVLEFNSVTSVVLPHHEPWGPSSAVMSASHDRTYRIEMQSGDCLEVEACGFQLHRL